MKIVIDARESGTSTGRYIDKLVENLHALKPAHDVTILTKAKRIDFMKQLAPSFTAVETPYKEFTFSEQLGFKKQLDQLKSDLVHFGMVQQPVMYKGRVVTTIHDLTTARFRYPGRNPVTYTIRQEIYKWVIRKASRKSRHIMVPTEFVKQDLKDFTGVSADKITVTLESADKITEPAESYPTAEKLQYLLYVGRPGAHKNLNRLLLAFQQAKLQEPGLSLVLAGKKDEAYEQLKLFATQQGITNVIFTDWVSDAQLRWLYEHALAYVFPSLSEGFGLPPLEAMHYDLPVIASNATCIPEVCGDAATYFDPLNVDDIAQTILKVVQNKQLQQQLAAKGREQLKKYSWRRMAEQTLAVYEDALKS